MEDRQLSPHFKASEFWCKCADQTCVGKSRDPDASLVRLLEIMRTVLNAAMVINSGIRCPAHNKAVGGVPDSAHLSGKAADIRVRTSMPRYALARAAMLGQCRRIGIGPTIMHVDVDDSLPLDVCWLYVPAAGRSATDEACGEQTWVL